MKNIGDVLGKVAAVVGGLLFFFFAFTYNTGTVNDTPSNAVMFLNDQARTYVSPLCVSSKVGLRQATAADASAMGYKPDKDCVNQDGFLQKGRSLFGRLLEKVVILFPLPSRWNADGTWNW